VLFGGRGRRGCRRGAPSVVVGRFRSSDYSSSRPLRVCCSRRRALGADRRRRIDSTRSIRNHAVGRRIVGAREVIVLLDQESKNKRKKCFFFLPQNNRRRNIGAMFNPISSFAAASLLAFAFLCPLAAFAADLTTVTLPGERLPLVKVAPEQIPQPAPLTGTLAPNSLLKEAQPVFEQILGCSECVFVVFLHCKRRRRVLRVRCGQNWSIRSKGNSSTLD